MKCSKAITRAGKVRKGSHGVGGFELWLRSHVTDLHPSAVHKTPAFNWQLLGVRISFVHFMCTVSDDKPGLTDAANSRSGIWQLHLNAIWHHTGSLCQA